METTIDFAAFRKFIDEVYDSGEVYAYRTKEKADRYVMDLPHCTVKVREVIE